MLDLVFKVVEGEEVVCSVADAIKIYDALRYLYHCGLYNYPPPPFLLRWKGVAE